MRTGIIASAVLSLGLVGVPSMVNAGEVRGREETHVVRREARPVEVRHDVVRHDEIRRDVRVDEHVIVDRDHHRVWDHDHWYVPAPVVTVDVAPAPVIVATVPCVIGFEATPVAVGAVPPAVLNSLAAQTGGAPIVSAVWLHRGGSTYFDMQVAGPNNTVQTLRFGGFGVFFGYV